MLYRVDHRRDQDLDHRDLGQDQVRLSVHQESKAVLKVTGISFLPALSNPEQLSSLVRLSESQR